MKVKLSESYHISTVPTRKPTPALTQWLQGLEKARKTRPVSGKPTPAFQDLLKAIERARKERRQVKKG